MSDSHSTKGMEIGVHQAQRATHDLVPGTVRLFDSDGNDISGGELLLSPAPSTDPEDPLNWSTARKNLSLFNVILYTVSMGYATGCLFSIYVPYSESSNISIANLNQAVGIQFLLVGFTPLITNPLAAAYGKRLVYLASMLLGAALCFWSPYITSGAQWNARCALFGVAGGPIFSLTEISIADVFFLHQRATPMSIYVSALYTGTLLAPLVGAYIYGGMGVHAVFNFAGGFILLVFCFSAVTQEETTFHRAPAAATSTDDSKVAAVSHVVEVKPPSSWLHRMRLITRHPDPIAAIKQAGLQPLAMLRLPIVWWCGLQYGWYQVTFNIMNAITASILAPPPYLFGTSSIGLTYLSPTLMTIPGAVLFGWASDKWTIYMAQRNGGVSDPEHKLWLMAPIFIGVPGGFLMMGLGPYYGAHWIVYTLGMGLCTVVGSFGTTASLTYLFDVFHDFSPPPASHTSTRIPNSMHNDNSPYMLSVLMPAMSLAFGFGYIINPWVANLGLRNWSICAAGCTVAVNLTMFPMIWWGKALRRRGASVYYGILS